MPHTGAVAQQPDARPNVLLIGVDDLNDWVGALDGHAQASTPNVDQLAQRGTLFTNAHCQAPVCRPSRASLMTGLYPSTTGLYFLNPSIEQSKVARQVPTLPERFAKAGYRTLGVGKLFHWKHRPYFDEYGGRFGGMGPRPEEKISYPRGHPLWDWGAYPKRDAQMPDHKVADWAIKRLNKAAKTNQPFFLGVGFFRPHVPMYAPQKWFDQHPRGNVELPQTFTDDRDDLSRYAKLLTTPDPAPPHEWLVENNEWRHAVQAYLACTTFADHQVGRVLDALRNSEAADNTVVVLFSDHGFHLGEKQRWAKRTLWETSTRVPMIVAGPGAPAGQRSNRPVGLIDIYPTLLDLTGIERAAHLEGRSLTPLLADPAAEWNRPIRTSFGKGNYAVRSNRWRYIRYADGSEELYDRANDPRERHNLAEKDKYDNIKARLREHLPDTAAPILGQGSTGHRHYKDAAKVIEK
jgi:arylsulfatase A-like enzyme